MAEWAVEILNDVVEAELLSLPKDMQARFLRISELLESFGPHSVGLPHVRPLGEKLWEMRLSGREGIGCAISLHAFVKKTQKTPHTTLNLALKRLKESGS